MITMMIMMMKVTLSLLLLLSLVLFDLFVNILAHNLAEPAYEADVAQLEYKLVAGEHGLMIRLKGFNHKLPVRTHTDTQTHTFWYEGYSCSA